MENIFDVNLQDSTSFNEDPQRPKIRATDSLTSSIETSQIDPYRQGTEITEQKHFSAGIVKITSGEPGHRLLKSNFGIEPEIQSERFFKEPETVGNIYEDTGLDENGAIEPLTIRTVVKFNINEKPVFHSVKGALQTGNEDFVSGGDIVVNSQNPNEVNEFIPFIDDLNNRDFVSTIVLIESLSNLDPFVDQRFFKNDEGITSDNLDSYVNSNESVISRERFNTCGWDSENNTLGTDSIVYVGLKY